MHIRKRIALTTATVIGVLALAGGLVVYVNYPDRNWADTAEVHRAKADIAGIETAVHLFHERNGRYPQDLTELTEPAGDNPESKPWRIKMPINPWGGAYQYRLQPGP